MNRIAAGNGSSRSASSHDYKVIPSTADSFIKPKPSPRVTRSGRGEVTAKRDYLVRLMKSLSNICDQCYSGDWAQRKGN